MNAKKQRKPPASSLAASYESHLRTGLDLVAASGAASGSAATTAAAMMTAAAMVTAAAVASRCAGGANRSGNCNRCSHRNSATSRTARRSAATAATMAKSHRRSGAQQNHASREHEQLHILRHSKNLQIQNSGRTPCPVPSSNLQPSTRRPAGRLLAPTAVQVPLFVVVKRNPGPLGVAPRITAARRGDDDDRRAGGESIVVAIGSGIDRRGVDRNRNRLTRNDVRCGNRLNGRRADGRNRIDRRTRSRHRRERIVLCGGRSCWPRLGYGHRRSWPGHRSERIILSSRRSHGRCGRLRGGRSGYWLSSRHRSEWIYLRWLLCTRSRAQSGC